MSALKAGLLVPEIQSEARICTSNTWAADTDAVGTTDTDAVGAADTDAVGTTDTDAVLLLGLLILMLLGPLIPMLLDLRTTLPTQSLTSEGPSS